MTLTADRPAATSAAGPTSSPAPAPPRTGYGTRLTTLAAAEVRHKAVTKVARRARFLPCYCLAEPTGPATYLPGQAVTDAVAANA